MATIRERFWQAWSAIKEAETIWSLWQVIPASARDYIVSGAVMTSIFGVGAWMMKQPLILIALWASIACVIGLIGINQLHELRDPRQRKLENVTDSAEKTELAIEFSKDHSIFRGSEEGQGLHAGPWLIVRLHVVNRSVRPASSVRASITSILDDGEGFPQPLA